jgi:mono/diheme cytochrome c family protein
MKKVSYNAILAFIAISIVVSCAKKSTPSSTTPTESSVVSKTVVNENDIAAGHQIFDQNCGKCHRIFTPQEFKEKRWVRIIDEMAPKARLNDNEKQKVLAYVVANAKK